MFCEFYKFREQPFGVTPDPRFLYFGSTHREALASLLYAIETKRGFSALVAEPGMGKTSLLFRMLDSVQKSAKTAFLFQTEGDSRELMRSMLRDLGIEVTDPDPAAMHEALNQGLLQELHAGKQVVVVIDEAQNLDSKVLETVRLLSNFETSTQKLMHIVLAGQPGLAEKLSEAGMTQLRQRVSTLIRLEPFPPQEVGAYIEHRLRAGGYDGPPIFTKEAIELIARVSQGIPRNINSLCFQALSIGYAIQAKQVSTDVLREVVSDFDFSAKRNLEAPLEVAEDWPPRKLEVNPIAWDNDSTSWDHPVFRAPRLSRMKWVAAIACLFIVPISMIALNESRSGTSDSLVGRLSSNVANSVLSSGDPNADFVPPWLDKLKPPPPPEIAKETTPPASAISDADSEATSADRTDSSADTAPVSNLAPPTRPSRMMPPGKYSKKYQNPSDLRSSKNGRSVSPRYGTPSRVQILRSETLFQFAQEIYGQSNWSIIEAICAANPSLHDPYSILRRGEWVKLPSDLTSVTSNFNTRSGSGRYH